MESSNGKLRFDVGIDNSELLKDAEKCKELLAGIGSAAAQQGDVIDRAFGASGAAKSFSTLGGVISKMSENLNDMDFGTVEEKIASLSKIIRDNEGYLENNTKALNEYRQKAEEAFRNGDNTALENANANIDSLTTSIAQASERINTYKGLMSAVMTEAGMGAGSGKMPMLFDSEEDIKRLEELKEKIASVKAELDKTASDGGDTSALTAELTQMNEELNSTELAATKAATALGTELGSRAIEAQQSLYQLNQAVSDQEQVIANLTPVLEEAKTKYEELQATEGASSAELETAAAAYDTLAASMTSAEAKLAGLQTAQQEAQQRWREMNEEINSHDSILAKMLGGYDNMQAIVGKLPQPMQMAVSSLKGMTGAAKAFIATPLGAVLAALILAYQTIKTALSSTAAGQMKLTQATGYLTGVLNQLKEIVVTVGNALFKAFSNPKKAIQDLWQAVKENVVNRFKAVGDMAGALGKVMKAAFTFDWDGVKTGLSELTESFIQFGTGIDNLPGKVGKWVGSVNDAAKESATIATETKNLEIEVSKWQTRNQQLEQQKAKARGQMYNSSLSTAERKKAKEDFEKALNEQIAMEAKFADKRIELQKRSMALTSNTIEDENTLRDLEAQREAIETRRVSEMASLERRSGSLENQEGRTAQAAVTAAEKRLEAQRKLGDMEADLVISNNERKISLMRQGLDKTLAEIEHEKTQELQKIKELEDKFKAQNVAAGVETQINGLTKQQEDMVAAARKGVNDKARKDTEDSLNAELSSVLTYEQKRLKIQEEFQERRNALYKKDAEGNITGELREGVTQGNIDELNRQSDLAMTSVDEQFASRSELYQAWCNQIGNMTLEQLNTELENAKKALQEAEASGATGQDLAVAKAKVSRAEQAVKDKAAQQQMRPGKRTIEEWKDLHDVLGDCVDAFEAAGDALGGVVGASIKSAGEIATKTMSMINSIVQLTNSSTASMAAGAEAAGRAIQAVERASVILTIISIALEIAMKIINAVKAAHDGKLEKNIESAQEQVDRLQTSYDALGDSIERAYSKDASQMIEKQNNLLRQQQGLINDQIAYEEAKKSSDEDKIDGYKDKLKDISKQMEENKQKAIDAIFGEDLQSSIENFADAYADAWTKGENRSMAVKDTVKNMMRQMVQESIKAAIAAGGQMEAIRRKLQEFYADGVLTDWEQKYVMNMADKIQEDLNAKFGWADKMMKDEGEDTRTGTSTGITGASQETIDELNGRATAIQGHTFSISENTQRIFATTSAILNSVLHIEDHTDDMSRRMGSLESGMKEVRDTLNDISIKGIKIK